MSEREALRKWAQRLEDLLSGLGSGNITGPVSSTLRRIALWSNTNAEELAQSAVEITDIGSIVLPGAQTVDGRDLGTDAAARLAHVADTANPHVATAAQVGLGNVSNVAQLTRGDGDWAFSAKTAGNADYGLIEDSAAGAAKKRVLISDFKAAATGTGAFIQSYYSQNTQFAVTGDNTFVDISGIEIQPVIVSGDVLLVYFSCSVGASSGGLPQNAHLQLFIDGANLSPRPLLGALALQAATHAGCVSLFARISGLSAGTHSIKVRLRAGALTGQVDAGWGAGSPNNNTGGAQLLIKRVRV